MWGSGDDRVRDLVDGEEDGARDVRLPILGVGVALEVRQIVGRVDHAQVGHRADARPATPCVTVSGKASGLIGSAGAPGKSVCGLRPSWSSASSQRR